MRYRQLGRSGLTVSELCLGTMMFGGETDEVEAGRILASAREAGVNSISTVDVYHDGRSEEIVGRLIGRDRDAWLLSTEVGGGAGVQPNRGGLSRRWLLHAIDASLRRLGTDYVDIWYLHLDDRRTPFEEVIAALETVIRTGKVRYWGFSNFSGWQIGEMVRVCDALGAPRPAVAQPLYHAMNRQAETDYLPACAHYGLGVMAYSPLARGVLTAKYDPDRAPPPDSRAGRGDARMMESEYRRESLVLARQIAAHAESRGLGASQLSLRWVLNNAVVSAAIAGPRTLAQWDAYLAALDIEFTAEDEALFARLVPGGHASTAGFSDPRYPCTGRRPVVAAR